MPRERYPNAKCSEATRIAAALAVALSTPATRTRQIDRHAAEHDHRLDPPTVRLAEQCGVPGPAMQEIAESRGGVWIPLEGRRMDRQIEDQVAENSARDRDTDTDADAVAPPKQGDDRRLQDDRRNRVRPAIEPLRPLNDLEPADRKAEPQQIRQEYQTHESSHRRPGLGDLDGQSGREMSRVHQRRLSI
jgi:hypothetical protein